MHPNQGHKFRNELYMSGAQVQVGGRASCGVCALWMPRLLGLMESGLYFDDDSGWTFDLLYNKNLVTFVKLIINLTKVKMMCCHWMRCCAAHS
jgi:hypothetical protein